MTESKECTSIPVETLYVLYGSQMGNSEGAAKEFCQQVRETYQPSYFKAHGLSKVQVLTKCMQLDDFLELEHAAFSKCLVIFVSSYGVGQAPLGAYRFRQVCDYLLLSNDKQQEYASLLDGLSFCICGLGDSTYPTNFQNPTKIDEGLQAAGAKRIGERAHADAHGRGETAQDKTIAKWIQGIWLPLAKELANGKRVDTKAMQEQMIPLLMKLDPDYTPPKHISGKGGNGGVLCSPLVLGGLAVVGIAVAITALHVL